jgi:glutamyl-tRNA(Gln) amidotransferase subunit E
MMTTRDTHKGEGDQASHYIPRSEATPALYTRLGFRCGLEIHQQLRTTHKLFCRCPAGFYQDGEDYDAQLVRHMRPTLSELGEYDGTALMEFKTRKNITYRIKGKTACTYDIDDTPPFPLNRDALSIAMKIALLLQTSIVGELHITRKQYLDGSIPTGFQRTAIVGIDGRIPLAGRSIGIRQLSIEEDSCREVSDLGHERIYTTDRLGMPLVETVTEPELLTPDEAAAAANYIRFLTRSTGQVNVGIGAAREDVNVSIAGGTRVEIKGVQHIRWIPELTHNEAFRQKALLEIRDALRERVDQPESWTARPLSCDGKTLRSLHLKEGETAASVCLPSFAGLLSFQTHPTRSFSDEISDRVKVVACIDKPHLTHPEDPDSPLEESDWRRIRDALHATDRDAVLVVWGPQPDMETAIETITERCGLAFDGVPNETRKALADGTTLFERVLPGPDRMYPDTDSAPIPITEEMLSSAGEGLPTAVSERLERLVGWSIPADTHAYILRRNLFPLLECLIKDLGLDPVFVGTLLGHTVRHAMGDREVDTARILAVAAAWHERGLTTDLLRSLVPHALQDPEADFDRLLLEAEFRPSSESEINAALIDLMSAAPKENRTRYVMGRLRPLALGNVPLSELARKAAEASP